MSFTGPGGQTPPSQHHGPQGPTTYSSPGTAGAPYPGGSPGGHDGASPGGPGAAMPYPPVPPERRKSWFARHKVLTALLALVVLVLAINALGDDDGDAVAPANAEAGVEPAPATDEDAPTPAPDADAGTATPSAAAPVEPQAPAEPVGTTPGIGDPARDGKFEFVVTAVESGVTEVGNEYLSEVAQGQFVLVHVTVTNIGDRAQSFSDSDQTLVDGAGREHSSSTTAGLYLEDNDTFYNEINPGNTVDGTLVFDVPADAVPTSLELHDSMFSGGVTVSLTD